MIKIKTKHDKSGKISISIKAAGTGADLVGETVAIVTELPKAIAEKNPVLLVKVSEEIRRKVDEEKAASDSEETEEATDE